MEGILNVTPEKLESTASEFSNKGNEIANLTSQMTQLVTGLSSVWEGDAAAAYTAKFRELEDDIQRMVKMVNEHSSDLTEMARVYRDAEKANESEIQGLSGDVIV